MRVSAITLNRINNHKPILKQNQNINSVAPKNYKGVNDLSFMPVYQIPFTSIQNSSKLRALFRYRLPCIYSGVPMIDPKQAAKLLKSGVFNGASEKSVKTLSEFSECYSGMEKRLFDILTARSKVHPDYNLKQLIGEVEPFFRHDLRKKQSDIFHNIELEFKNLPEEYQSKFNDLMTETYKRVNKRPVFIPFSAYEFKYKLAKIRDVVANEHDLKSNKVMKKLIKESKKLPNVTNKETKPEQKRVLGMLDWILKKSVLKDNPELKELISTSRARLTKQEVILPFSRKSYLYDLHKIVENIPDEKVRTKIMDEAFKLPTSSQDFSAYLVKLSWESSDRIASRILWPYLASVEHIVPRSVGGADTMFNFAGATTREISLRKSIDFTQQMKLRPDTPKYCQQYVDKLIDLYKDGEFAKNNVNPKYIEDFKKTIKKVSKGQIDLDISKYYEALEKNSQNAVKP